MALRTLAPPDPGSHHSQSAILAVASIAFEAHYRQHERTFQPYPWAARSSALSALVDPFLVAGTPTVEVGTPDQTEVGSLTVRMRVDHHKMAGNLVGITSQSLARTATVHTQVHSLG